MSGSAAPKSSAASNVFHVSPVGLTMPNSRIESLACFRNCAGEIAKLAGDVPMIRYRFGSRPADARWYKPGSSLRFARSPVAPKRTMTWLSGISWVMVGSPFCRGEGCPVGSRGHGDRGRGEAARRRGLGGARGRRDDRRARHGLDGGVPAARARGARARHPVRRDVARAPRRRRPSSGCGSSRSTRSTASTSRSTAPTRSRPTAGS